MTNGRREFIAASIVAALGLRQRPASAQAPSTGGGGLPPDLREPVETIDLWPSAPPGRLAKPLVETVDERSTDALVFDLTVYGIARPRIAVFRPDRPNGAAVLIIPGGGYRWVVVDKEGYEMARWLAARGFTAFVLFYRLPGEGWSTGPDTALADAQRAMRLIRRRAGGYALDPERVAAWDFPPAAISAPTLPSALPRASIPRWTMRTRSRPSRTVPRRSIRW